MNWHRKVLYILGKVTEHGWQSLNVGGGSEGAWVVDNLFIGLGGIP